MRSAEPGQRALLEAGQRLLANADLARLSVNAVVAEAYMAKGSFYQHWPGRRNYLVALHRAFHDKLANAVEVAIDDMPPGLDRIATGMTTYLDGCLACPATKALLVQARTDAELAPHVAARNHGFAQLAAADLQALGWRPAEPIAALFIAAIAEIALQELAAGHRCDDLRSAALGLAAHDPTTARLPR